MPCGYEKKAHQTPAFEITVEPFRSEKKALVEADYNKKPIVRV